MKGLRESTREVIKKLKEETEYQKFFTKALKKYGKSSPSEMSDDEKKEFFDYVDKNWKGDHEEVEQDVHKTYKMDGRRKNFREKMKKLGYICCNLLLYSCFISFL